jgi:hypothetical protein
VVSEPAPELAERIRGACAKRVVRVAEDEDGFEEVIFEEAEVPSSIVP